MTRTVRLVWLLIAICIVLIVLVLLASQTLIPKDHSPKHSRAAARWVG